MMPIVKVMTRVMNKVDMMVVEEEATDMDMTILTLTMTIMRQDIVKDMKKGMMTDILLGILIMKKRVKKKRKIGNLPSLLCNFKTSK